MGHACPRCGYAPSAPAPLTPKQHALLAFVTTYLAAHGFAPAQEEIAAHLGLRSLSSVHEHLTNLERKGWIRREYNTNRSIELLAEVAP